MSCYELGVIGAGNMAEAILRGVIDSDFLQAGDIIASDPARTRRDKLRDELAIECVDDNLAAAGCRRLLLAVKPQTMSDVLSEVAPNVQEHAMVVSIAAGVTTSSIDAGLGGRGRIVRVMPNTPMLVGAGMSAVAAGPRATEEDLAWTRELFSASGRVVSVAEDMIDAVTAVSASGPAYFFYLVEAMIAAGVAEGLDADVAAELARQTCLGAGKMLVDTLEDPAELRRRVTSPGGTTQRAIETLDADSVKDKLTAAVRAAAERSRELGK